MKRLIFIFTIVIFFNITCFSQGKLKKAEESLIRTEDASNKKSKSSTSHNNISESDGNFLVETIGRLLFEAILYTSYYTIIESPFELEHQSSNAVITKYPYLNSNKGSYSYNWGEDTDTFRTTISSRFLFETNRLYGNHLNVDIRLLKRFGIEVDYLQLWEENVNFENNSMAIYTTLAKYHRVRTERFDGWWGLGAAYVDGDVNQFGFTYGLGAELFFTKPFSLESNFNQTLINNKTVNKFNALFNFYKNHYKFTGGYEHLKIGDIGFSTFNIGVGISF